MSSPPRQEGFRKLTRVHDALRIFLDATSFKPTAESVPIHRALGRILAEDVVSRIFLPATDRSVMDGYAVRLSDVAGASERTPVVLTVIGESKVGETCRLTPKPGEAVSVATGSMIPQSADAVVIFEHTKRLSDRSVEVHAPADAGEAISKKGEDVAPGAVVLGVGRILRPEDVGILRALGFPRVHVRKRPKVAVISTGNELVDFPRKSDPSKVVDINRLILSGLISELGAIPVDLGIAADQERQIMKSLMKGLRSADLVLVTAGSSVGRRDLVPSCINKLGKPGMLVHGISMRPSMPTGLAVVRGKPVISLPGFPVSAMIAFRSFARPLIAKMVGRPEPEELVVKATLTERIRGPSGFKTFVRVFVRSTPTGYSAEPLKTQRSAVLTSMVSANGIVTIPENVAGFDAGQVVDVSLIGSLET